MKASILLAVPILVFSQARGEALELDRVLDAHCEARADLESLRATFTQTKVFTVFDEQEESTGEFVFLAPDMLSWRFAMPDSSTTVIKGDVAWTMLPHIRQVQKVRLGGSSTDRIMSIVGFGSCGTGMKEEFDIALKGEDNGLILLEMVPVSDEISPYFSIIELGLDPGDFLPRLVVFREHSGDCLIFEFDAMEPGAPVSPDDFELSVPDGYELIEY
jgi:outer membrane lipoprotein-sorting protein